MGIRLDKIIKIQKHSVEQNENNFETEKWIDFKKFFASINNLYGREFWEAKSQHSEKTINFTIRYSKSLYDELKNKEGTKKYRIAWDNRTFDISFVDNIKYENKWINIKAIER
ncbi:phage head closure protein [Sarcina ventriculi]|uniref:phage head closure protein n=1 Tax=Sarcina ventriculi TaxID=1267 RepID=UPI00073F417F|nr:phage head closure protein [Sarcina ventriculi]